MKRESQSGVIAAMRIGSLLRGPRQNIRPGRECHIDQGRRARSCEDISIYATVGNLKLLACNWRGHLWRGGEQLKLLKSCELNAKTYRGCTGAKSTPITSTRPSNSSAMSMALSRFDQGYDSSNRTFLSLTSCHHRCPCRVYQTSPSSPI